MAKQKEEEEIDEDFIIASMNMTSPSTVRAPEPKEKEPEAKAEALARINESPKEESRKRKPKTDYEALFIRETPVSGRQGKTTYLREEYYNRILKIIMLYKNPKLSVFAYVDAVLQHHFEVYEPEIMDIYNKKNSAPY